MPLQLCSLTQYIGCAHHHVSTWRNLRLTYLPWVLVAEEVCKCRDRHGCRALDHLWTSQVPGSPTTTHHSQRMHAVSDPPLGSRLQKESSGSLVRYSTSTERSVGRLFFLLTALALVACQDPPSPAASGIVVVSVSGCSCLSVCLSTYISASCHLCSGSVCIPLFAFPSVSSLGSSTLFRPNSIENSKLRQDRVLSHHA